MRYHYVVTLKKDSSRASDILSILLCLFSVFNFLYVQVRAGHPAYFLLLMAIVVLAGAAVNLYYTRPTEAAGKVMRYRYWLIAAALGWLGMPYLQWLAALFFLLAALESQTKHPLEIGFTDDRIVINNLIRRQYQWTDLANVVLRDGLLTLDFKSNRIFQKEVLDDDDGDAEEDEFNEYCRGRLNSV